MCVDTNTAAATRSEVASRTQPNSSPPSQQPSKDSEDSHTAAEFLNSQLQLEADAREALPYKFDNCTKPLGKLRQSIFSCLTCNPPPINPKDPYNAAGVCYSCSIQCHGEHNLVELFSKRDFECDCGTTRFPDTTPCILRINQKTGRKGGVHSEQPSTTNKYNQNFQNRFCGCECIYDPEVQNATMFQCLGLGSSDAAGCGEDWWHPECVVGYDPSWREKTTVENDGEKGRDLGRDIKESKVPEKGDDTSSPPGFPAEEDFEGFICYKCIEVHPWIKRFAHSPGFLPPVYREREIFTENKITEKPVETVSPTYTNWKKRIVDQTDTSNSENSPKRVKSATFSEKPANNETEILAVVEESQESSLCKSKNSLPTKAGQFSLFFKEDFRTNLCHCDDCFVFLKDHPQLLEPEEIYEPSVSSFPDDTPGSTAGSGSIYDRGESVLKNIDRVRAIEGVMAYNNLKDKLKPFFQQFAESGQPISAEDIKTYFAKIRGDESAIKEAGDAARLNCIGKEPSDN